MEQNKIRSVNKETKFNSTVIMIQMTIKTYMGWKLTSWFVLTWDYVNLTPKLEDYWKSKNSLLKYLD